MKRIRSLSWKAVPTVILVAVLISMTQVFAVTVGVKEGDSMKYDEIKASWSGTGTTPSDIVDLNRTEWMSGEVQSVSGNVVTIRVTTHYRNETEETETFTGDIATASGNITVMIIPAGLQQGDVLPTVFGTNMPNLVINVTTTRTYAGASRSVNILNVTSSYPDGTTLKITAYWDKDTGVLLEFFTYYQSSIGMTWQESFKLTETNMWSPSGGSISDLLSGNLIYIVGIVVLIVIIAVGVIIIRRRKPPPTTAPAPTAVEETKTK